MGDHTRQPHLGGVAITALAALVAVGCAGNGPLANAKVSQAERAVEEAQQAGAAASAPLEFRTAQDKLTTAQSLMARDKPDHASRAAEQATVDAEYARAVAADQRASTVAEEMGQYIKLLRQELDRLPK